MKYSISKDCRFEAAHRLTAPYEGKCAHLHGHSFVVKVTLAASELDARGFVEDFSSLKPLRDWIDANLDHATLVSDQDQELLAWMKETRQKHYVLPLNPTSEIIARVIFEQARKFGFQPLAVDVMETCTSAARYGVSL
jgi:6-pyruvoyltetrahydropterin/6-carboxytetrahydropterin synthase